MRCAMKKAAVLSILIAVILLSVAVIVDAQQAKKVFRIGYLSPFSESLDSTRRARFRQGLRDLGYVEGKDFTIEFRLAEGKRDRLHDLVEEMVRLEPVVIVIAITSF